MLTVRRTGFLSEFSLSTVLGFGFAWLLWHQGQSASADASAFALTELPHGKSVTLPHPALTKVPVTESVYLTSTDRAQTVKITLPSTYAQEKPLHIAIYDSSAKKVQHLKLSHRAPLLYTFRHLSTILITPNSQTAQAPNVAHLLIESNRPLEIKR